MTHVDMMLKHFDVGLPTGIRVPDIHLLPRYKFLAFDTRKSDNDPLQANYPISVKFLNKHCNETSNIQGNADTYFFAPPIIYSYAHYMK